MQVAYDKDSDSEDFLAGICESDINQILSQMSSVKDNGHSQRSGQKKSGANSKNEIFLQRKQIKSDNCNLTRTDFNFGEMKTTLAPQDDSLSDESDCGAHEEVKTSILNKRLVPPSMGESNVQANNKYRGGFNNKFGQKDPGGKPVLLPLAKIEMKPDDQLKRQHSFRAEGLTIYFPFKPYQCQVDFMAKVVKALNTGENALLESPTGTGKTLSLLCASLAWLKHNRETNGAHGQHFEMPRIIYTSRTHSQLAQVQKELRNTAYNPRSVIIGSRDHLCVHPEIKQLRGHALNTACKKAQKSLDPCAFGKNRDIAIKNVPWSPLDIEELHEIGNKLIICPYFASKDRVHGADIIFMPYNYLIDEKIRENFEVNYKGSVIIFDEAHNASSTAEDVSSFEIVGKTLELAELELQRLQDERRIQEEVVNFKSTEEEIDCLLQMTRAFHIYLEEYELDQNKVQNFRIDKQYLKENSVVMPGKSIFDLFQKGTQFHYLDRVNQVQKISHIFMDWQRWMQAFDNTLSDMSTLMQANGRTSLESWFDIVKKVMRLSSRTEKNAKKKSHSQSSQKEEDGRGDVNDYYLYIFDEDDSSNNQLMFNMNQKKKRNPNVFVQKTYARTLAFWCFNAGIGFKDIQDLAPRSIILTSGTLTPLNSFQAELQLSFQQRLENPHVISAEQVSINILTRGIQDNTFNFSFQNRDNEHALVDLGLTLASIAQVTPGGMLVFFPSYRVLQKCDEIWSNSNAKNVMEKHKKVFMEPKDPSKYQATMDSFYKAIFKTQGKTNGAILMGVCRGRISEGLDFSDNAARCVVMVGIPYPQMTDAKVILKKDFLDKRMHLARELGHQPLSGKDWYSQQATRAVNQAIGRVIRHVQDYGAIVLIDERYNWGTIRSQISKWLRDRIKVHNNYSEMQQEMKGFFSEMGGRGFKAKVQQLGQVQLEFDGEGITKKIDINSEEEEAKSNNLFLQNIFNKKKIQTPGSTDLENPQNKGTISRFFKTTNKNEVALNLNQKRTHEDLNNSKYKAENSSSSKRVKLNLSQNTQKLSIKRTNALKIGFVGGGLGFINDDNECVDMISSKQPQPQDMIIHQQEEFGLRTQKTNISYSAVNSVDKIASFTYNPLSNKKNLKDSKSKSELFDSNANHRHTNANQSMDWIKPNFTLNPISNAGGLYSTDKTTLEDKQQKNKNLIEGFKKVLDNQEMKQMIVIIKEIKECKNLQPVFMKLRETMFGKAKSLVSDKSFKDKMKLMESLGEFIPNVKREEYKVLLGDLTPN